MGAPHIISLDAVFSDFFLGLLLLRSWPSRPRCQQIQPL